MEIHRSIHSPLNPGRVPAAGRDLSRYTWQAMLLHWLLAFLVIGMLCLGFWLGDVPKDTPARGFYVSLHKSFGVLALLLVLLRLGWRATHRPPPLPSTMPRWQKLAASTTHGLLYLCILLQPLSGYLASVFSKNGVRFFGIELPYWGWDDKPLRSFFGEIHGVVAIALVVLITIHVLAAMKHLLLDRDQVFRRMWPGRRRH